MNQRQGYYDKAEDALSLIEPGDHIVIGSFSGEPQTLVETLVTQANLLSDVTVYTTHIVTSKAMEALALAGNIRLCSFLPGSLGRIKGSKSIELIPEHLSRIGSLFTRKKRPVDGVLLQVSPPDRHGYCSLGPSVDFMPEVIEAADWIVAEINDQTPRVHGPAPLHIDRFNAWIETSRSLKTFPAVGIGKAEQQIGKYVAGLIPDGSTLEIGLGSIPAAVLNALHDKQNLSIHSGMFTDDLLPLLQDGTITNEGKPFDRGQTVATLVVGSQSIYDFIDDNPSVALHPSSYTHSPKTIGALPNFVAVNSALQVDLYGQVNAEMLGGKTFSAIGGLGDFTRGAQLSAGGISIIALRSATRSGHRSKIVPAITDRGLVSVPHHDIDFVVTEFGVADLRGATRSERAQALRSIAHPDFRSELNIV